METRANLRRVSTRPLVLFVALLSALALAMVAWYSLTSHPQEVITGQTTFHFYQDRPGPDAPSRNRPAPSEAPDPWAGHGH